MAGNGRRQGCRTRPRMARTCGHVMFIHILYIVCSWDRVILSYSITVVRTTMQVDYLFCVLLL
jgi:hypothetical protein